MGISSQVYPGLSNKIVEVEKSASVPKFRRSRKLCLSRDAAHRKMRGTKSSCETIRRKAEVESFLFSGKCP